MDAKQKYFLELRAKLDVHSPQYTEVMKNIATSYDFSIGAAYSSNPSRSLCLWPGRIVVDAKLQSSHYSYI